MSKLEKVKELLPKEREKLTKRYFDFIANRHKVIPCPDEDVSMTMENYISLLLGEERKGVL